MKRLPMLLALCLLSAWGCGGTMEPEEAVPLEKLPPAIMKKAQQTLPGFKFTAAWKKKEKGQELYEIRGKNKQGQTREVEFSLTGELITVE